MAALRILAVDDEPAFLELIREHLSDRYEVETAAFATEAVRALEARRPELLLLDINMPGVDGLTLFRFLRKLDITIPVIVITGNQSIAMAEQFLRDGAFAYAPKPLNLGYLDHLVAAAIGP